MELAERGVRVAAVCPGDVDTPALRGSVRRFGGDDPEKHLAELLSYCHLGPGSRFTSAEQDAEGILFLACSRALAITGACLAIDQGLTAGL